MSNDQQKEKFRSNVLYCLAIIGCVTGIIALILVGIRFYHDFFQQPRAKLTVSVDSITFNFNIPASMIVVVRVTNYSPRTAYLTDWNLALNLNNTIPFQYSNPNCTNGTTTLSPSQQTEFIFSYDIGNNTSIDLRALKSVVFTASYIDDQGTQQEQFEFSTGH